MEGQRNQIEKLRKRSVVALFWPTSFERINHVAHTLNIENAPLLVTSSLKHSAKLSDIVVKFVGHGQHLSSPRDTDQSPKNRAWASTLYPESYNPVVSFVMLSQYPQVHFAGPIKVSSDNTEYYVRQNGAMKHMSWTEFREYHIRFRAEEQRRKQSQRDVEYT
jgi:hypothetical protein